MIYYGNDFASSKKLEGLEKFVGGYL